MKDHSQRIEYIRKVLKAAQDDINNTQYHTIKNWRGKPLSRKQITVDADYLMYRLENSRTEIQQMAFVRNTPGMPKNLFDDPESVKAQEAQELILNQINNTPANRDFFEDLKMRGQDDFAIITYDGYLVNGNRRTAALKTLGTRYIDCIVLPEDTTPRDIYELEQELQISEDFREDYHWINELRNIRKGLEDKRYGYSEAEIAKRLRISELDLKAKRRMLNLLDSFLIWKGIPGQYDYPKLDDTEQIFIQLEKAIKKRSKEGKNNEELQNAVFTLIEQKPSKGRLYGYVLDLIKSFDQIYAKMQSTSPGKISPKEPDVKEGESNILDSILEGEEQQQIIFNDPSKSVDISSQLIERIADVKAENKEKTDTEAVYQAVSASLRELQGLTVDNDTAKIDSIKNKLDQIISTANELLLQIKSFEN